MTIVTFVVSVSISVTIAVEIYQNLTPTIRTGQKSNVNMPIEIAHNSSNLLAIITYAPSVAIKEIVAHEIKCQKFDAEN